ncbi:hypothetical protein Pcinc_025005 [Petrolisthes cinctipes]|uniref:C2H2-type domain-containing protein n=1 Tax=Petrolisthes cinctipes TaxID=88211 RepID=A0AAE1F9D3_PETCI|nr:hypothetical protein Pcinc_025005 [Petrolisthes cinctipes]
MCPVCGHPARDNVDLRRHLRVWSTTRGKSASASRGRNMFVCGFCGYSARDNDNLNRHIRTHTGEKPFACPFCPHRTTQKSHLKNHGVELPNAACHKQHEGLKMATVPPGILPPPSAPFPVRRSIVQLGQEGNRREYWCRVCGYQAISESKLIIHFRKHTGEKPFVCSYCSYRCAHKSNLITHVKTRHAEQEFHKQ